MNLAPHAVLASMVNETDLRKKFVGAVESYRTNKVNDFKCMACNHCYKLGADMTKFPAKVLRSKSSAFRVSLGAESGAGHISSTTILQRNSSGCVVLFENIH